MKKKLFLVFGLFILAVVAVGAYRQHHENEIVTISAKTETLCSSSFHQGSRLLSVVSKQITVPRWQARSVKVERKFIVCPECLAAQKKKEAVERARAEREREIEEAKTKVPNLLGKNFKEIVAIMGEPSSTTNDIINFNWFYTNRPPGYGMKVDFLDYLHTTKGLYLPTRSNRAHMITVEGSGALARTILPARVLNVVPARIYFYPQSNQMHLKWHKGDSPRWYDERAGPKSDPSRKFTYYAELLVTDDQPIYSTSRWLDTNSGEYKESYLVTADWKNCKVIRFLEADGCKGSFELYEGENYNCIRIK